MDLLNLSANERLDLADLTYAIFDSQLGLHRQIINNVVMDPTGAQTGYVLSGFGLTNPAGNQLTVTRGVALLPYRNGPTVQFGLVSSEGSAAQTLDLSSRAAGTYNVYITFTYAPGSLDTRTLWSPDNGGREYAQSVPTRQVAGWQLIVESVTPGAEYLQIGTVTLPSMAIVDQRPFLFEGRPDQAFASAWGNGANDRSGSRGTYPVTNLATFVAAVQQCLVDIKGPGIAKWYTPYIAGQTIGFQGTAKAASTAWFDANFRIQGDANNPGTVYSGDGASLTYQRGANTFAMVGGTGGTSTSLTFGTPGQAIGATGPYSLQASANAFALTDNANGVTPLSYSPSAEALDVSGGGLNTLLLPPATAIKYAAPQTCISYLPFLDVKVLSGVSAYPAGPNANFPGGVAATTLNGQIGIGFLNGTANGAQGASYVVPLRLPSACSLKQIEIGNFVSPQISAYAVLMSKGNGPLTQSATGNTATVAFGATLTSNGYPNANATATTYGYKYQGITLNVASTASTDTTSYFLQVDLFAQTAITATSTAPYPYYLDYIKVTYTMPVAPTGNR